jgi:hypothetical protein
MHDRAVRLAVAHRRAVRPAWRVHQDGALIAEPQPFVRAGRCVALDALALGFGVSAAFQKAADRGQPVGAQGECPVTGDADVAMVGPKLRRERERDVEPVRRQEAGRAIRPFHHRHGAFGQVVEAELLQFARRVEPVEVGMHHREARQFVDLHQREGRARHLYHGIAGEMADHGTGEGGLAGAEVARQRDQVAGLQRRRDVGDEALGGLLVRQRHRKA